MQNYTGPIAKLHRRSLTTIAAAFVFTTAILAEQPWRLRLHSPEEKIDLHIDLYEESIDVPGLEAFGPMNGYLGGNIYGVWYVVGFDIKDDRQATLTIANDLGSEDQKLTLTQTSDSTYQMKFLGYNAVKRAQGRKLVKIPGEMRMVKSPSATSLRKERKQEQ